MLVGVSGLTVETKFCGLFTKKGSAGAGKGVISDRLVESHSFVPVAFADPLKRILQDVYGFTDQQLWGPSQNRNAEDLRYPREGTKHGPKKLTPRYALQVLGELFGRDCYEDTWVDYAIRVAKSLQEGSCDYSPKYGLKSGITSRKSVVITDLRYLNEFEAIKRAGGKVIRCIRPVTKIEVTTKHPSERGLLSVPDDRFDWVIQNTGTLEDLQTRVDEVLDKHFIS